MVCISEGGAPTRGFGILHSDVLRPSTIIFAVGLVEVPLISNEKDNFGQVLAGVMYGLNAVLSGFDAHRRANESNREHGWELEEQALRPPPGVRVALVRMRF